MNTVMQIDMQVETPTTLNMVPDMAINMGGGAVNSVNGQTGDVVLTAADVGALPDSTEIPTKTSDLVNDSGYITSVPVDSVNGYTGAVVLNASDVGAMASGEQVVRYEAQTLTDAQQAQARANINAISADEIGTVFNIKGDVATYADLPQTGNTVGDVYYVADVSAGYVWLETTAHPLGYWEELGEPIDLSGYIEKPVSPTNGQFLQWDGSAWVAATYTPPVTSVNARTGAITVYEIFWCTYGTTTSSEIEAALTAGKLPMLIYNDYVYTFRFRNSSTNHRFICNYGGKEYTVACQSNTWFPGGSITFLTTNYTPPVTSVNGQTGAVVISNATTTTAGLMSATDKSNLDILVDDYSSALQALGVI